MILISINHLRVNYLIEKTFKNKQKIINHFIREVASHHRNKKIRKSGLMINSSRSNSKLKISRSSQLSIKGRYRLGSKI